MKSIADHHQNITALPVAQHRPRSAVGQALVLHHEAVLHCEALYAAHEGEVVDEVEQAEVARDVSGREALEALARYRRWLDDRDATVAREREALARFEAETARRRDWADKKIVALAEQLEPNRSKITAGVRTISLRRTTAVMAEDLEVDQLPQGWRREKPARVIPATVELDKKAAKADLLGPWNEGEPPGPGWYEVDGWGMCWITKVTRDGREQWTMGSRPGDDLPSLQDRWGLSIEPEAGLDLLRWRHAAPGVRIERRTHVTVR